MYAKPFDNSSQTNESHPPEVAKPKNKNITSGDGKLCVAYSDVNQVCIAASNYPLLQYLLLFDLSTITSHTCYFTGYAVGRETSWHLPAVHIPLVQSGKRIDPRRWLYKFSLHFYKYRYPFLREAELYALDNAFASPLIGRRPYSLLSDGPLCLTNNMQPHSTEYIKQLRKRHSLSGLIERMLFGPVSVGSLGNNSQCVGIYMTERNESFVLQGKSLHVQSLQELWDTSCEEKREFVKKVFGITDTDVAKLNSKRMIFLTQPIVKDCGLSEQEYVGLLRRIFGNYDTSQLLIKLHPRDNFDYSSHFPDIAVYSKTVNMQLLALLGVAFERAITICSSSVGSFSANTEVDWYGSDIHPQIKAFFGEATPPVKNVNTPTLRDL